MGIARLGFAARIRTWVLRASPMDGMQYGVITVKNQA
jgi:hypothetical protein